MASDHLAKEAERLQSDPVFAQALAEMRTEALDALAAADADNKTMIIRLQQKVAVIDGIPSMLSRFILKSGQIEEEQASPYA